MPAGPQTPLGAILGSPGSCHTGRGGGGTVGGVAASRLPLWATLAGAVVGLAVTAGLVVAGPLRLPTGVNRSDATADFLAAWERSRRGTFVVRATYERRQPGGAVLSSPTELVQRPPDRLLRR